jgi:hypothetical protein
LVDQIVIANRSAAERDNDVGLRIERLGDQAGDRLDIVPGDAEIEYSRASLGADCGYAIGIGRDNLIRPRCAAGQQQLVTGGDDRYDRLCDHRQGRVVGGGGQSQGCGV